jgi:hypothetical protein
MQQGFGQMGAAMQGMPGMGGQTAMPGGRPMRRNAFMVGIAPEIAMGLIPSIFGGIGSALESTIPGLIGSLLALGAAIWWLLNLFRCVNEMRTLSRNPAFPKWPLFIPIYGLYYCLIMLPQEMTKAKQMNGAQTPARSMFLYFLFPVFALQSDLNDMAG